jgi:hypothetical protein
MVVIITFFRLGNNWPIFRLEISMQEWEIAMLCVINKYGGDYPFVNNMCDEKYIKKFWSYFNLRDKCYDVIEYESLFFFLRSEIIFYAFLQSDWLRERSV